MKWLFLRQAKGKDKNPVDLWIPVDPKLADIIDATPTGDLAFIQNSYGKPFTAESFGNNFRDWSREAGIVGKPLHGLRKAAAAMLAENGCTEQEIMAITGHSTSKEVIRYTRSAKQKNAPSMLAKRCRAIGSHSHSGGHASFGIAENVCKEPILTYAALAANDCIAWF